MRKLFIFIAVITAATSVSTSCRMAPRENLGDTVAAKYFEPADTSGCAALAQKKNKTMVKDSADIFFVGSGSTATQVQLVSYPSRRDTVLRPKGKRIKVVGNADYGHVVRAKLWVSASGDTLVTRLEKVETSLQ